MFNVLPESFYLQKDVCAAARNLLGKVIYVLHNNSYKTAIITETEAYAGVSDRASHAFGNRRTPRTEVMYSKGGVAYVYLCYGIHHLFNVVTNLKDVPDAVLIRSVFPFRQTANENFQTLYIKGHGPGRVTKLLGIGKQHNGISLLGKELFIVDHGIIFPEKEIITAKRIGIDYAGEDALLPFRFYVSKQFLEDFVKQL